MTEEIFATKLKRVSVPRIELVDIERIKKYQQELINLSLYEKPRHESGHVNSVMVQALYSEISECEKWIKKVMPEWMNDKNRKQKA